MSNFDAQIRCETCDRITNHRCLDDTPTYHLYTVKCKECGRKPIRGVTFDKLRDILEEDYQWR